MPYRGRLIFPMRATISRLNTEATAAATVGGLDGYDRIFREPVEDELGVDARTYLDPVVVNCQVQTERSPFEKLAQTASGREVQFKIRLCLHYFELESAGLIAENGSSVFQPGDRLDTIHTQTGTLLRNFEPEYLFLVHTQDRSFGLSGGTRNLLLLYFDSRNTTV